jgi:hypothetical protein
MVDEKADRRNGEKWSARDWMEWQATGIAPRILMPKQQTEVKIKELICNNEMRYGAENRLMVLENSLHALADFFCVPPFAAKIRMLDLGYHEAEGVFTYISDHYINTYSFKAEAKNRDCVYCISPANSFNQYVINKRFQNIINSGNFIYVSGHYIINDSKYVKLLPDGIMNLTDYAKLNIDECCLRFDLAFGQRSLINADG